MQGLAPACRRLGGTVSPGTSRVPWYYGCGLHCFLWFLLSFRGQTLKDKHTFLLTWICGISMIIAK